MSSTLDIVVAAYVVKNGKLLLIHHKKLDKWLPSGGHIDSNETPDEALRRELKEETGLDIEFCHYPEPRRGNEKEFALPFYVNRHHIDRTHFHYCLFYLCTSKTQEISIAKSELKGYKWVTEGDLESLCPPLNEGDLFTCREAIRLGKNIS